MLDIDFGAHHHPRLKSLTYTIMIIYNITVIIIYIIIDIIIYIIILTFKFQFCNHIFRYLGFADQWHTGGKHLSEFRRETWY